MRTLSLTDPEFAAKLEKQDAYYHAKTLETVEKSSLEDQKDAEPSYDKYDNGHEVETLKLAELLLLASEDPTSKIRQGYSQEKNGELVQDVVNIVENVVLAVENVEKETEGLTEESSSEEEDDDNDSLYCP